MRYEIALRGPGPTLSTQVTVERFVPRRLLSTHAIASLRVNGVELQDARGMALLLTLPIEGGRIIEGKAAYAVQGWMEPLKIGDRLEVTLLPGGMAEATVRLDGDDGAA